MSESLIQGHVVPSGMQPAGYGKLVERHQLRAPLRRLTVVSDKAVHGNKRVEGERTVFGKRDWPGESDAAHLEFAINREPLDLLLMKKAFEAVDPKELAAHVEEKSTLASRRRLWFLYEWLTKRELPLQNQTSANYADMLDPAEYYTLSSAKISTRHRIRNNLPGTPDFCALARREPDRQINPDMATKLAARAHSFVDAADRSVVKRAASYLLLADSRSTFEIEGEDPPRDRQERWGRALGLAGRRELSVDLLCELQREIIEDHRLVELGLRKSGVFLGTRDSYGEPRPEFIGARPQDVPSLVQGMINYDRLLRSDAGFNPVAHAAGLSFGFVYAHPLSDGNGRIHRYLISHVLGERKFGPEGVVLPISTVIKDRLEDYSLLLQGRSGPLLPFIPWKTTAQGNVEVTADTADLYRYVDVTEEANFLTECVAATVDQKLPNEIRYLEAHGRAERRIAGLVDMPSASVSGMIVQIIQNNGSLSKKRRKRDYAELSDEEASAIETMVREEFGLQAPAASEPEEAPSEPRP